MDVARPQMPRLDLRASQVTSFELFVLYPWSGPVAEIFDPLLSDKAFKSRTIYRKNKRKHLFTADVRRIGADEDEGLVVRLSYEASDRVQSLRTLKVEQREDEFLPRLLANPESPPIGVTMVLELADVDPAQLWFPLPSRIGIAPDTAEVFEIRGVRGVKLASEEVGVHDWEYLFTLERPDNDEVFVSLHFDQNLPFSLDVPLQALKRGVEIARRFTGDATTRGEITQ